MQAGDPRPHRRDDPGSFSGTTPAGHNGVWGGCWCAWFHPDGPERKVLDNRGYKPLLVEQGRAHAALVFDGEAAACRLSP